jgi:acyl carrier protein
MQAKLCSEEIQEKIKHILISKFEIESTILPEISSTTPLLERSISLGLIEALALVAAIEKEFNIEIDDDDLTLDLFKDIGNLAKKDLSGKRYKNGFCIF